MSSPPRDRFEAEAMRRTGERKLRRKYAREAAWDEFKTDWVGFVCYLPRLFAFVLTGMVGLVLFMALLAGLVWSVRELFL